MSSINSQENIVPHRFDVSSQDRAKRFGQKPLLLWFTGLSGSGKSTISNFVEKSLFGKGFATYSLDGDNIRTGICNNLNFSIEDRRENIRRISEVSKLMLDAGLIVCASFISPFRSDRELVRTVVGNENFIEIFIDTPLSECERRDVKGLYAKARNGEIPNFTGISSPYESPKNPDIIIRTTETTVEEANKLILQFINKKI